MTTAAPVVTWRRVNLTGGQLNGCTAYITNRDVDRGVIRVPAAHGRYVHIDGDWCWETDHAP